MSNHQNEANQSVLELSNALVNAAEQAGTATVLVDARRRFPASGILYTPELVLTADHVVEREEEVRVILPDGSERSARLAGRDASTDLALLRLDAPASTQVALFTGQARVGQLVLALGRPSDTGIQASLGVISALGGPLRTGRGGMLEAYLATDAVPLPGFSGGPLVDVTGRVLGVNTSGLRRGISLTIPVQIAWQIAESLAQHGRVRHGYLGIRSQPVPLPAQAAHALGRQQSIGLLIVNVEENSPAAAGGLLMGDILVAINGMAINDPDDLSSMLSSSLIGQAVPIEVLRGGQPQTLPVTIGERK